MIIQPYSQQKVWHSVFEISLIHNGIDDIVTQWSTAERAFKGIDDVVLKRSQAENENFPAFFPVSVHLTVSSCS